MNNYETMKIEIEKAIKKIEENKASGKEIYTHDEVIGILVGICYEE